jgi:hypothetical protein
MDHEAKTQQQHARTRTGTAHALRPVKGLARGMPAKPQPGEININFGPRLRILSDCDRKAVFHSYSSRAGRLASAAFLLPPQDHG